MGCDSNPNGSDFNIVTVVLQYGVFAMDYSDAEALISLFFLFWRFLYQGYIGHLASPVHITMKTKVVDTNLSISLDQAVSIQPYSTYAIREW